MSDDEEQGPEGRGDLSEEERQEVGAREQGTLSEHSSDLSSPQLTEPPNEREDR